MNPVAPNLLDYTVIGGYFLTILLVGYSLRKRMVTTPDFLLAGRKLPVLVTGIAFVAANCGALEVMGMISVSAKYGARACHFYWIGAIPAMLFLALYMMPIYYRSRVRSVPEFLRLRFDEPTRAFNATSFATMMVVVAENTIRIRLTFWGRQLSRQTLTGGSRKCNDSHHYGLIGMDTVSGQHVGRPLATSQFPL